MPLLPAELFFYSFPGEIECPNPECANSLTWRRDKTGEYVPLVHLAPQTHERGASLNVSSVNQVQKSDSDERAGV